MAEKIKWEDANFKWEKAPTDETKDRYTWDSVLEIIEEVTDVSTGGVDVTALEKLDKKYGTDYSSVSSSKFDEMYEQRNSYQTNEMGVS